MRSLPHSFSVRAIRVLTAALAVWLTAGWLAPATATAHTCASACNQIRRACNGSAKAALDFARTNCDTDAAACAALCQGDPLICPGDGCEACIATCGTTREACRVAADDARIADRATCDTTLTSCDDVCVDPIDGACVQGCKATAQHQCLRPAKKDELTCKQQCPKGAARQACFRQCRRALDLVIEACGDSEVRCVSSCIGLGG